MKRVPRDPAKAVGLIVRIDGALCELVGIGDGRTLHFRPVDAKPCPTCGHTPEHSFLDDAPLFQDRIEPVRTVEYDDGDLVRVIDELPPWPDSLPSTDYGELGGLVRRDRGPNVWWIPSHVEPFIARRLVQLSERQKHGTELRDTTRDELLVELGYWRAKTGPIRGDMLAGDVDWETCASGAPGSAPWTKVSWVDPEDVR